MSHDNASNREDVMKRPRQWTTVDSDSDDVEDYRDVSKVDHKSYDSDRSISSDSSSDSDKEKKTKKHRRDDGDRVKKSHKRKDKHKNKHKHKKDKKEQKKDKKSSKDVDSSASLAINQNEYGKYGIIREEHFHQKQREFDVYMEEVKKMPGMLGQSKREIMNYFKCYIEDYNTATMPHVKYYNMERWEMDEYRKSLNASSKKADDEDEYDGSQVRSDFNDEADKRKEMKRQRDQAEIDQFHATKQRMISNKDQQDDMRHQSVLRAELTLAYKQGDLEKVRKIEQKLKPDAKTETVKHPWA